MTTAFVLSGGGSLGAVQVGMLQALADREVEPDFLVGTSVGALNAACPLAVSSSDFRHATELIDRARVAAERWIDAGGPKFGHPERFLALHRHDDDSFDGGRAA